MSLFQTMNIDTTNLSRDLHDLSEVVVFLFLEK
jgi:hypothetical protein